MGGAPHGRSSSTGGSGRSDGHRPRGWSTVVTAIALSLAGLPAPAQAITNGSDDGSDHPYVAMVLLPGATRPSCTGVLVAGTAGAVVLTAAHCLFHGGRRTGTGIRVTFDSRFTPTSQTYTGSYYISPRYDPSQSLEHDLAAVVLAGLPPVAPAQLAPVGVSTGYRGDVETVGTGKPLVGVRRVATETVVSRDGQWLNLTAHSGNSCDGDSGGPDLLPGTNQVLALTDQGTCATDRDQRVDMTEAYLFLSSAPQWARHAPLVTTKLSQPLIHPNGATTLVVRVSPLYAGELAVRQVSLRGTWTAIEQARVDTRGLARFRIRARARGSTLMRVKLPSVATHPAGLSRVWRLTVR